MNSYLTHVCNLADQTMVVTVLSSYFAALNFIYFTSRSLFHFKIWGNIVFHKLLVIITLPQNWLVATRFYAHVCFREIN